MTLVDIIGEKRRHQQIVNDVDKKIVQQAIKLGVRNTNIDTVYELVEYPWKMVGNKVLINWKEEDEEFQELDMCITEYTNDGPIFIFSVWDCNIAGNIGEDAIVLLNGRNLIGELDEQSRIKR